MQSLFHLALNVRDLAVARQFYVEVLHAKPGRSTQTWLDVDFFGHQLSLHLGEIMATANTGLVGEHKVPMPHFGVVLPLPRWQQLAQHLLTQPLDWIIKPNVRFAGQAAEQHTLFFYDPFKNPIEIKGFADFDKVFHV